MISEKKEKNGLYEKIFEHDACGCGVVCDTNGIKSHEIIANSLKAVESMKHRCASGAEINSGDGAGILSEIPHQFFCKVLKEQNVVLPDAGLYGVGQIFLSKNPEKNQKLRKMITECIKRMSMEVIAWRKTPTNSSSLGKKALSLEPDVQQVFINPPAKWLKNDPLFFERKLFVLRLLIEKEAKKKGFSTDELYFCTMSSKKIVYKGMLLPTQLRQYYLDLHDRDFQSTYAIFHTRFSTNTHPSWPLAHPFRYISHNGEINTICGNINWMKARSSSMVSEYFSAAERKIIFPLFSRDYSDSRNLDLAVELLTLAGRSVEHVLNILVPEAWEENDKIKKEVRDFKEFYSCFCEPWDGPASICFSDGTTIGCKIDRNGLRPARLAIYENGVLSCCSEIGAMPFDAKEIKVSKQIFGGEAFCFNLTDKKISWDEEIKTSLASLHPYSKWVRNIVSLKKLRGKNTTKTATKKIDEHLLTKRQKSFGYTQEELRMIFIPMTKEIGPIGSMGNDAPLAVLSNKSQNLFNYFHQLFAQVTNPPIDPIREKMFMSLITFLGSQGNILQDTEDHAAVLKLQSPFLDTPDMDAIKGLKKNQKLKSKIIPIVFDAYEDLEKSNGSHLKKALDKLVLQCEKAVDSGNTIIILSDFSLGKNQVAIPSLLAVGAVHHHLIRRGKRCETSLVLETGEARQPHHFAVLLGYGCNAIYPYCAIDTVAAVISQKLTSTETDETPHFPTREKAIKNYFSALEKGILKIISKMGISTIRSYIGAQIFEAVGLSKQVIDQYFSGTPSRVDGIGLFEIEKETLLRYAFSLQENNDPWLEDELEVGGNFQWRQRGEKHLFSPMTVHKLQQACRTGCSKSYAKYSSLVNDQSHDLFTLRGLLEFTNQKPIDISKVESKEKIFKRFATGAMSYGSISKEAHTTLALAMNKIGGKSNTGEGGEDASRFHPLPDGSSACSAIKQVASGRFGVTALYLNNADDLQIKIAQGAKPGEGGQLPGHKIDQEIARVRCSTPGVGLISPPPHHDIYSIEDLAQLIHDLKHINDKARVSVKLVSEMGIGTIAAGIVKCLSDHIVVAGHDGGTGASPLVSIKHAGLPWELGLSETHQTLLLNGLRNRVVLQADGQMKTGRDLAIATLLGAEEWGVATAALIAMGCIMMRKCHLNTCPVGIATQDKELRTLFNGEAQHVVQLFDFMAEELRQIMAQLGFATVDEMVGRTDKLKMRKNIENWKAKKLSLDRILAQVDKGSASKQYCFEKQHDITSTSLDYRWLGEVEKILAGGDLSSSKAAVFREKIDNTMRAVGALTSSRIVRRLGEDKKNKMPKNFFSFHLTGVAGQSFGAFASKGMLMQLDGFANDYFGKGLSGATLIVKPPSRSLNHSKSISSKDVSAIGNVSFYGATGGKAFICGNAGERFCVRNSGAEVVVEGVGANGCEYMTKGIAIILGSIGRNFAAGMSGGIAYLWNPSAEDKTNINADMVLFEKVEEPREQHQLKKILQQHVAYTKSQKARMILDDFKNNVYHFLKIIPIEYKIAQEQKHKPKDHKLAAE